MHFLTLQKEKIVISLLDYNLKNLYSFDHPPSHEYVYQPNSPPKFSLNKICKLIQTALTLTLLKKQAYLLSTLSTFVLIFRFTNLLRMSKKVHLYVSFSNILVSQFYFVSFRTFLSHPEKL